MHLRHLRASLLFALAPMIGEAQLNKWLVRETSGEVHVMDLTQTPPTVGSMIAGFGSGGAEDVNLMTDGAGNILFSCAVDGSDLISVRDANFASMPNGEGLFGNNSCMESCITPVPCRSDRWFIIHRSFDPGGGFLYYSEVDLSLNGGLGDVTATKNVLLSDGITEGFAVTRQTITGCRWLFACRIQGPGIYEILRFLITDQGIGPPQVITTQNVSSTATYTEIELTTAMDHLALSTPTSSSLDPDIVQWDLDLNSGALNSPLELSLCTDAVLGIEYSPLDQWLYWQGNSGGTTQIGRVSTTTFVNEVISNSMGAYRRSLEEGGNGRIYSGGEYYTNYLAEIADPDNPDVNAIGYNYSAILVSNNGTRSGLPNAIEGEVPGSAAPTGYIAFSAYAVGSCDTYQFVDSTCLGTWWEWDLGDGTITNEQAPEHQFAAGTYTITLRVVACGDTLSLTKPAYITSASTGAIASFDILPDTACAGVPIGFTNTSQNATAYTWDLGDGTQAGTTDVSHPYSIAGVYAVLLIADGSCGPDTAHAEVIVLGGEAEAVIDSDPCDLQIAVQGIGEGASGLLWSFGDGTTSTDSVAVHAYTGAGAYVVTLITNPGSTCADSTSTTVNVNSPPNTGFGVSLLCDGVVTFTDQSTTTGTLQWIFGDGTNGTGSPVAHGYAGAGPYFVQLTLTDSVGCTATATDTITPVLVLQAAFSITSDPCSSHQTFENGSPNADTFSWDFGDGTASGETSPAHDYAAPGTYPVVLIAEPGSACADTVQANIVVVQGPIAHLTDSVGCDQEVFFADASINADLLLWNLGDGASSNEGVFNHEYAAPGIWVVTLIASNDEGCVDTASTSVVIAPPVVAIFSATFDPCEAVWAFNNTSANWSTLHWDLGDGATSLLPSPSHTYNIPGAYVVQLIAIDATGCSDTLSATLIHTSGDLLGDLFVPNCFTPNGDDFNERFVAQGNLDCITVDMRIFNRWGELIFEDRDHRGWDGNVDGTEAPEGTYVYVLETHSARRYGMVTLLR